MTSQNEGASSAPELRVGRRVVLETIRLAALEVPGVGRLGRGGPRWLSRLGGRPLTIRIRDGHVAARLYVVAQPGQPFGPLCSQVRVAVGGAIERLLGLETADVTVVIDGVANSRPWFAGMFPLESAGLWGRLRAPTASPPNAPADGVARDPAPMARGSLAWAVAGQVATDRRG